MKPHLDISHQGTLGDEDRVDMKFDENSIAHLMSVLIDLYSDRELAVIREYSTNALDSHIAAGNTDPIEVTLPSQFSQTFVVKDRGVGMSMDTIKNFFSKYGASSKRDSDEATGMLGLGCKAGLTYSSQFTVISHHNGLRITVLVTRNANGAGALQVIDTASTSEPNGVEIKVPISNITAFNTKAKAFFYFWDPGLVLVDGQRPDCIWEDDNNLFLDPDVLVRNDGRNQDRLYGSFIVMGQVPYLVSQSLIANTAGYDQHVVARVPIGTVDFTPSREQLNYTKRTKEVVSELSEFVRRKVFADAQTKIDSMPDSRSAYEEYKKWKEPVKRIWGSNAMKELKYKGLSFPLALQCDTTRTLEISTSYNNYRYGAADNSVRWKSPTLDKFYSVSLFVVGHMGTAASAATKAKVRIYCEQNKITGSVLLVPERFGGAWWDDTIKWVPYDEIKKIQIPDSVKQERQIRDRKKYRMARIGMHTQTLDLDKFPDECVAWIPAMWNLTDRSRVAEFAQHFGSGPGKSGLVAIVLASEEKRFKREHPLVPRFEDWWIKAMKDRFDKLTPWEQYLFNGASDEERRSGGYGKTLPVKGTVPNSMYTWKYEFFLDPELRDIVREYQKMREAQPLHVGIPDVMYIAERIARDFEHATGNSITLPTVGRGEAIRDKMKWIKKNYHILFHSSRNDNWFHIVEATNALYIVREGLHVIPRL